MNIKMKKYKAQNQLIQCLIHDDSNSFGKTEIMLGYDDAGFNFHATNQD